MPSTRYAAGRDRQCGPQSAFRIPLRAAPGRPGPGPRTRAAVAAVRRRAYHFTVRPLTRGAAPNHAATPDFQALDLPHDSSAAPPSATPRPPQAEPSARPARRWALMALGFACVALGAVGTVVPGLPTTIFMIVALWAFSKSSPRFHAWLYGHRIFGPPLQAWHAHRVIPPRAKALAITVMAISLAVTISVTHGWLAPVALAAVLVPVAVFIATRPGRVPGDA